MNYHPKDKNRDIYGGYYPFARQEAINRSEGKCQFCGLANATQAHHWEFYHYPSGDEVTEDDLTALCWNCHSLATGLRGAIMRKGVSRRTVYRNLNSVLYGSRVRPQSIFGFLLACAVLYFMLNCLGIV